jgi:hypothetical protein
VLCKDQFVLCLDTEFPRRLDVPAEMEVDKVGNALVVRIIIKDDQRDPLYVEFEVTRNFVERVSRERAISVRFVREGVEIEYLLMVGPEELRILRTNIGL